MSYTLPNFGQHDIVLTNFWSSPGCRSK